MCVLKQVQVTKVYCLNHWPLSLSYSEIERKISIRSTREELIRKGVLKDVEADQTPRLATIEQQPNSAENSQNVQVEVTVSESNHVSSHGKYHQVNQWLECSGDDGSRGWKVFSRALVKEKVTKSIASWPLLSMLCTYLDLWNELACTLYIC